MAQYRYKCSSKEQRRSILLFLIEVGFCWHGEDDWYLDKIDERYPFREYPSINITPGINYLDKINSISGSISKGNITLYELFQLRPEKIFQPVYFALNKEYKAIIKEDTIEVGCQTFSHSTVLELAEKIKEVHNK